MHLIRFVIRRILTGLIVLWAVSTVTFILFFARPVEIVGRQLAGRAASPAVINETIRQLGLNQSLLTQYWHFIDNLLHGNLGYSFYSGESVNSIIKQDLPPTASIVFGGVILWLVIGLSVGILSATRARSLFDPVSTVGVLVGISMPVFVLGDLILPWIPLAVVQAAIYTRLSRGSLLDTLGEDYIRTARAKGLSERRVIYRHGVRAAMT